MLWLLCCLKLLEAVFLTRFLDSPIFPALEVVVNEGWDRSKNEGCVTLEWWWWAVEGLLPVVVEGVKEVSGLLIIKLEDSFEVSLLKSCLFLEELDLY